MNKFYVNGRGLATKAESFDRHELLQAAGLPLTYAVYIDEGHNKYGPRIVDVPYKQFPLNTNEPLKVLVVPPVDF